MVNKKGFTLFETMLVLMITSGLICLGYTNVKSLKSSNDEKIFLQRFEMNWKNMYRLTNYNGYRGSITFRRDAHEVIFLCQRYGKQWARHITFPESLSIANDKDFIIGKNGAVSPNKVVFRNNGKEKYEITAQMGWGVYELKRSS